MKHYIESIDNVLKETGSQITGISQAEADARLEKNGKNKLAEGKKTTLLMRFLSQLANPMVLVLIGAAIISAITAVLANESLADVFIIMFVVILNAVLGVVQESKAEAAIEALKEMSAATSKVIRDGEMKVIKSEDLVVGDIIVLEAGDAVPADARIIESASLKIEEAALTGESVPVEKDAAALEVKGDGDVPLGDRVNMMYMTSNVVYGRGKAVVTATGMDTEVGKIADAITKAEEGQTPLQIKLASLSKTLTFLVLGICVFIFAFGVIKAGTLDGSVILDTFMLAVSLAVAAIPEGLAAVVTIVLSIGVTKMSKRNAIIRKLTAVETLGCTQVICSDKTGTLTQNRMTVVEYFGTDEKLMATSFALCSDAELDSNGEAVGDPTQNAVVNYANKIGLPKYELAKQFPRVGEIPFDSARKMMTTVHSTDSGKFIQHTTGAPDVVIGNCTHYLDKDGKVVPATDKDRQNFSAENKKLADKALRVLAAAYREYDANPDVSDPAKVECNLIFLGLVGMIDPVRDEVPPAIEKCRAAGIRPIMITGDHRDTAAAIAKQLGIIKDQSEAITGAMLDDISDEQLKTDITKYSVYARVKPEHKVRIVNAWRDQGMVTAMTGDGVNDAPSIKSADIGIGMGITGTDVTKNVADMILADDNFATIVSAVEEGRRIYDNIRKSIQFLLSSNLSEVVAIFVATILGFTILSPIHILFINLITDSLPALALGMEKGEPNLMKRKPRPSKEGIFSGGVGFNVCYQGVLVAALTVISYFVGHFIETGNWQITESMDGVTMAFLTLSMCEIFHAYNMRTQDDSVFKLKSMNWYLLGAMVGSLILTSAVLYVPVLREIFGFAHISLTEFLIAMALAVVVIPIVEIVKLIERIIRKSKEK
nr:cation-translocating P-type ATPase [Clostridia bacterium]